MDFAQPIVSPKRGIALHSADWSDQVFHRLLCLTVLGTSPIGQRLTHLVLRLPRRNTLTALTAHTPRSALDPPPRPYAAMTHLDLSTTHIIADARFPTLLRLHPALEHLVLDRCTGLIGSREADTQPAILTLRWLGQLPSGDCSSLAMLTFQHGRQMLRRHWFESS